MASAVGVRGIPVRGEPTVVQEVSTEACEIASLESDAVWNPLELKGNVSIPNSKLNFWGRKTGHSKWLWLAITWASKDSEGK